MNIDKLQLLCLIRFFVKLSQISYHRYQIIGMWR